MGLAIFRDVEAPEVEEAVKKEGVEKEQSGKSSVAENGHGK